MRRVDSLHRLYHVKTWDSVFYTGYLINGNQVLMGIQLPELVMVEFDKDGNYLKTSTREVTGGINHSVHGTFDIDEDIETEVLQEWQNEAGFTSATISIRQFFLPVRWIGIKDLPDHYQEVLDQPDDFDQEERQELLEDIRLWRESGDFVFYWVEDYYLNKEGEVVSS